MDAEIIDITNLDNSDGINIKLNDHKPINFGGGIELLMNEKKNQVVEKKRHQILVLMI